MEKIKIIGGGLAGSEAAWQAAQRGINVELFEMRPVVETGAHKTAQLGELVCSNSLGSKIPDRATGVLQNELRKLGSLLMKCADQSEVPAGGALAVDREKFSSLITDALESHPRVSIIRSEVREIPEDGITIIASGPLTSQHLSDSILEFTGEDHLYFYDAVSPIVYADSIDMDVAFRASRYDRGETEAGDYVNCPFTEDEYYKFIAELQNSERIELLSFEKLIDSGVKAGAYKYFEGCLPVEVIAKRGEDSLAYGPMRPVGLTNPHTGSRPFAVVQLRQDNLANTLYNLVGFQTNLKFPEQRRVFRMIPGLGNARFARYGQMHRNTFINSPSILLPTLEAKNRRNLFFAGQITGVEGYVGNIATGLLAGINATRKIQQKPMVNLPRTTMLGALVDYITSATPQDFQPIKANFGILPKLETKIKNKRERYLAYAQRSHESLKQFIDSQF